MGIIRLLLALSVVMLHCAEGIPALVGGTVAVQTFYMISGFYMALILNEKYVGRGSYPVFISNRFLRLYPLYFVILLLTFGIAAIRAGGAGQGGGALSYYLEFRAGMTGGTKTALIGSNSLIFGQDILMFFGLDRATGALSFAPDFAAAELSAHRFLLVPQAWSIAVELSFYLVAPFLVRASLRVLILIISISLAARFLVYGVGYSMDPWTYRFFPFEIAFFLLGAACYRVFKRIREIPRTRSIGMALWVLAVVATIVFPWIAIPYAVKQWSYYALLVCGLPFIFVFSQKNRLDRWVGELSYPVYLSHLLVARVLGSKAFPEIPELYFGLLVCVASIVFSIVLMRWVIDPIDRLRHSRVPVRNAG